MVQEILFTIPRYIVPRDFMNQLKLEVERLTPDTIKCEHVTLTKDMHIIKLVCGMSKTLFVAGMLTTQILEEYEK
jgi:hypothetical protein